LVLRNLIYMSDQKLLNLIKTAVREVLTEDSADTTDPTLYSTMEACLILHISIPTLRKYESQGLVTCTRIGNRIWWTKLDLVKAAETIAEIKNKWAVKAEVVK